MGAPICGHWAFSTARCGCRAPDNCWHAHICMVCIDFRPTTFSGLPAPGPAPSCGHWVWYDGEWIQKRRYQELMKVKEKKEEELRMKVKEEELEEMDVSVTTHFQRRRGWFSFSQFERAYESSG